MTEPYESLCLCDAFDLWYIDTDDVPEIAVCWCGHPKGEHVFCVGSCTGEIVVYPALVVTAT